MENKTEYILCAANLYNDKVIHTFKPFNIDEGFVICGHRHHDCISAFAQMVGFPYSPLAQKLHNTEIQGFLTSQNRFVDRNEAGQIAFSAGQTKTLINRLHSEDLY